MREDFTEHFSKLYDCEESKVLKAERQGVNTLILFKLNKANGRAFGAKERQYRYELIYRWHKSDASPMNSVQGQDVSYHSHKECKDYKTKSLFDMFQLF